MIQKSYFVIDFDSTFVQIEALDTLASIVLRDSPRNEAIVAEIEEITKRGMNGSISFTESLERRLALFSPSVDDVNQLVTILKKNVTPSVLRNKEWFQNNSQDIYIISGGFFEYIAPVVSEFGIWADHILANRFVYSLKGGIVGFDKNNYLAQKHGKVKQLEALALDGHVTVIGDGFTDYEVKKFGKADKFIAFTENVSRDSVLSVADKIAPSFDVIVG